MQSSGSFRTRAGIVVEHHEGLVATVDESANDRIALPPIHSVALSNGPVPPSPPLHIRYLG